MEKALQISATDVSSEYGMQRRPEATERRVYLPPQPPHKSCNLRYARRPGRKLRLLSTMCEQPASSSSTKEPESAASSSAVQPTTAAARLRAGLRFFAGAVPIFLVDGAKLC